MMTNLIKSFNEQQFIKSAKQTNYTNINFPNGFGGFLESLQIEGVISTIPTRGVCELGHMWVDELERGGIRLETTDYPIANKSIGQLSVLGQPDELTIFQNILNRHSSKFDSTTTSTVNIDIEYHKQLNPKLWKLVNTKYDLKSEVLRALLKAAHAFYLFLELPTLDVHDIIITGSNCNYNWTDSSDIDLHLIIDIKKASVKHGKVLEKYLSAQKKVWNELRDINIYDIPVEFYIQDINEKHTSTGVYSIQRQRWNIYPDYQKPTIDDELIKHKANDLLSRISEIIDNCNKPRVLENTLEKLKNMRKSGLEKHNGEFSSENLIFKVLRDNGVIEDLVNRYNELIDEQYSVTNELDKYRHQPITDNNEYWSILFL